MGSGKSLEAKVFKKNTLVPTATMVSGVQHRDGQGTPTKQPRGVAQPSLFRSVMGARRAHPWPGLHPGTVLAPACAAGAAPLLKCGWEPSSRLFRQEPGMLGVGVRCEAWGPNSVRSLMLGTPHSKKVAPQGCSAQRTKSPSQAAGAIPLLNCR